MIGKLAAASTNRGSFVSAVAHLTNQWVAGHTYTGREKGAIQSAAAGSKQDPDVRPPRSHGRLRGGPARAATVA